MIFFKLWLENESLYPSKVWIKSLLRSGLPKRINVSLIDVFIVGSEARGSARPDSDLDIAVVIQPIRGKTSLQKTEELHQMFTYENQIPRWNNRKVDIQFFYPNDPELVSYSKIPLV